MEHQAKLLLDGPAMAETLKSLQHSGRQVFEGDPGASRPDDQLALPAGEEGGTRTEGK